MVSDEKRDPIGEEYFGPLVIAERAVAMLFYASAALSIAALLVSPTSYLALHNLISIAFPISVIALFAVALAIRLHFFPRAQLARLRDFLSHAFGKSLTHKKSTSYYNNAATSVPARTLAQVLESSFFTKSILSNMAFYERVKIAAYLALWLAAVLNRNTDLAVISVAAQVVFSEQILARWFRLEWFRSQCEQIYDQLFEVFRSKARLDTAPAEILTRYEIVKATAALSLSTKAFEQNRQALNAEWEEIRKTLAL